MFKQFINTLPGADFYMILSMSIFILFFILVSIYLFKMNNKEVEKLKNLPLKN